jgi:hypothetical protein
MIGLFRQEGCFFDAGPEIAGIAIALLSAPDADVGFVVAADYAVIVDLADGAVCEDGLGVFGGL